MPWVFELLSGGLRQLQLAMATSLHEVQGAHEAAASALLVVGYPAASRLPQAMKHRQGHRVETAMAAKSLAAAAPRKCPA